MTVVVALTVLAAITLAALVVPATAKAAPARPQPLTLRQPDGSTVTLLLRGDEFFHYTTDLNGQLVVPDEAGFYRLATPEQQAQWSAEQQLGAQRRTTANAQRRKNALRRSSRLLADSIPTDSVPADFSNSHFSFPSNGKVHGLILLVEYQDVKFTIDDPLQQFTDMMTKEGYDYAISSTVVHQGSAHDYFLQNSFGKFDPQFDVFGPLTLEHERAYYGKNTGGSDTHPGDMVVEGCRQLEDSIDFTIYDNDQDGDIDFVFVIFAGPGENAGASSDAIWPHQWNVVSAGCGEQYVDGKRLYTYACTNELYQDKMDGVGTFCHEFSHVLGLPDLYNTSSGSQTVGKYDILDVGCYNVNSYSPASYSSYERYELGWFEPTVLTDFGSYTLPELNGSGLAYLVTVTESLGDPRDGEYYLFENRQQTDWDKGIPGHGMMVWHIDYKESRWDANSPNNWTGHYCIDLVEAAGTKSKQDGSSTFPGTGGVTRFTSATTPAFCGWDSPGTSSTKMTRDLNLALINIAETDEGLITFDLVDGPTSIRTIHADAATQDVGHQKLFVDGRLLISANSGLYSVDGVQLRR